MEPRTSQFNANGLVNEEYLDQIERELDEIDKPKDVIEYGQIDGIEDLDDHIQTAQSDGGFEEQQLGAVHIDPDDERGDYDSEQNHTSDHLETEFVSDGEPAMKQQLSPDYIGADNLSDPASTIESDQHDYREEASAHSTKSPSPVKPETIINQKQISNPQSMRIIQEKPTNIEILINDDNDGQGYTMPSNHQFTSGLSDGGLKYERWFSQVISAFNQSHNVGDSNEPLSFEHDRFPFACVIFVCAVLASKRELMFDYEMVGLKYYNAKWEDLGVKVQFPLIPAIKFADYMEVARYVGLLDKRKRGLNWYYWKRPRMHRFFRFRLQIAELSENNYSIKVKERNMELERQSQQIAREMLIRQQQNSDLENKNQRRVNQIQSSDNKRVSKDAMMKESQSHNRRLRENNESNIEDTQYEPKNRDESGERVRLDQREVDLMADCFLFDIARTMRLENQSFGILDFNLFVIEQEYGPTKDYWDHRTAILQSCVNRGILKVMGKGFPWLHFTQQSWFHFYLDFFDE